jgi:hypothetical protein
MAGGKETKGTKAGKTTKPMKEAMTDITSAGQNAENGAVPADSAPDTGGFEKMSQQVRKVFCVHSVYACAHLQGTVCVYIMICAIRVFRMHS